MAAVGAGRGKYDMAVRIQAFIVRRLDRGKSVTTLFVDKTGRDRPLIMWDLKRLKGVLSIDGVPGQIDELAIKEFNKGGRKYAARKERKAEAGLDRASGQ